VEHVTVITMASTISTVDPVRSRKKPRSAD